MKWTVKELIRVILVAMVLSGCVSTIPMSQSFYNPGKVGVIIQVDPIGMAKAGSQGLLDMAMTPGNKFEEPLKTVEPRLNFEEKLKEEVSNIFERKNKGFVILEDQKLNFPDFNKPDSKQKYAKADYRSLKDMHNIDELLVLHAKHGILVSYYGVIELDKEGYAQLIPEVINLNDNTLMMRDNILSSAVINGHWRKDENYASLQESIENAIMLSLVELKNRF